MQLFLNNYETTLHTGISDTATTIVVYPSNIFDDVVALTGGDYYLLTISDGTNIEIVKCTGVSISGPTNILTVERDVSATSHGAFAFAAGSNVKMSVVAETLSALNEVLLGADYPPNLTVNTQTFLNPGDYPGSPSTLNIPFSPLVVQQINVDTSTPALTVNITAASSPLWGESIINLYRSNATWNWPTFTINGNPVGHFMGSPPASGQYFGQIVCRKTPGSGYLGAYMVSLEWVTKAPAAAPVSGGYPPTYTLVQYTQSADGAVLNLDFDPLIVNRLNITGAGSKSINVNPTWGLGDYGEMSILVRKTNSSFEWPSLTYNGDTFPVIGTPPVGTFGNMARIVCRRTYTGGGSGVYDDYVSFEWV